VSVTFATIPAQLSSPAASHANAPQETAGRFVF
jgi:hypothetical protein